MSAKLQPRSLADDLRQRDDHTLAELLRQRPDLLHPVPSDITAMTTRSTTGPSLARCLDSLDALHLHVLKAAAELTGHESATATQIAERAAQDLAADAVDSCRGAVDALWLLGLLWGTPDALRCVHAVRDLVTDVSAALWPRPELAIKQTMAIADVDAQAALHARAMVARVRDLLDEWSLQPPSVLRSGGLSLRDFAATTRTLHADWSLASLTIELAQAAGLLTDDQAESPSWLPTDHYDAWLSKPPAEQWLELFDAWLAMPRLPWLADEKTQVLSAERDRRAIPVLRAQVLALFEQSGPGDVVDPASAIAVLDDRQPRRGGELRRQTMLATVREAAELGVLGGGALSSAARLALAPSGPALTERRHRVTEVSNALAHALPSDVDQVVIQADLTVVAPGPLAAEVGRTLRLLADIESRGHATVYRISEASLRRALDAGWDAAAIRAHLAEMSRTPVPQPLDYLVDDVARRHGSVRVGAALGYARCDNPETVTALLADRRLAGLGLSRVADTVVVSQAPASELLSALRTHGYAPAAEDPSGQVVIRRPQDRRAPATKRQAVTTRRRSEDALIAAAIRSLRAGDHARTTGRGPTVAGPAAAATATPPPSLTSAAIVTNLRRAVTDATPVWIGYADTDGTVSQQIVDPIRVAGGVLTAFDHRTEQVRSFMVSRVTGVAALASDA